MEIVLHIGFLILVIVVPLVFGIFLCQKIKASWGWKKYVMIGLTVGLFSTSLVYIIFAIYFFAFFDPPV